MRLLVIGFFFPLVWGCTSNSGQDAPPLLVGGSAVEIMPPAGYRMAGYFYERRSTAVHDPLMARALVFRQGDRAFALTHIARRDPHPNDAGYAVIAQTFIAAD